MPPNEASYCSPFAPSTKGTIGFKQQDRSLASTKEGQSGSCGESSAEAHASKDSISNTSTLAIRARHDEYGTTSGTSGQKLILVYRPSPEKDADSNSKAGDRAQPASDQNVRVSLYLCYCYANHFSH